MALKLSLQEEERKKSVPQPTVVGPSSSSAPSQEPAAAAPLQPMPSGTTAATVSRVRALYDFVPSEPGELEFKRGDVIAVLESVYKDWWRGSLKGKTGIFPLNYVEKLTDPTPDELQREAQMEAEVFAEIKNVEKLLTLLSTNSAPREEDNEEISKLYHQTLAIRPKLIKLIEKYSQKKGKHDTGCKTNSGNAITDAHHRRFHTTQREIYQGPEGLRGTVGVLHVTPSTDQLPAIRHATGNTPGVWRSRCQLSWASSSASRASGLRGTFWPWVRSTATLSGPPEILYPRSCSRLDLFNLD
jgi:transcription antitermination factor NusG